MKVDFDTSFLKSLKKHKNAKIKADVKEVIEKVEGAAALSDLASVKKLKGHKNYYRIRIGKYRIGVELIKNELTEDTVRFIVVDNRDNIYKVFP